MIPLGKTLREAREAKGLTISQIAETTHMLSAMVQDLENEDFTRLPAPIYGRGFVKLYCEAVGLDPKPMIAEFMDLFNGVHEPTIRERPTAAATTVPPPPPETPALEAQAKAEPAPEPAAPEPVRVRAPEPEPQPSPVAAEPPARTVLQPGLFDGPAATPSVPEPPIAPATRTVQAAAPTEDPVPPPPERTFARYASPLSERDRNDRPALLPPSLWRMAVIGIALLLVLWGVIAGVRALYRATAPAVPAEEAENVASAQTEEPKPTSVKPAAAKPAVARKPQTIPTLYLD